jgi:hypothetical protein
VWQLIDAADNDSSLSQPSADTLGRPILGLAMLPLKILSR